MEENRIYYEELPCYQGAGEKQKQRVYGEPYFNLDELPEGEMRQEIGRFIRKRGEEVSFATILHDKTYFKQLAAFLQKKAGNSKSLKDREAEKWLRQLKAWMLENGMPLKVEHKNVYGATNVKNAILIRYFNKLLKFLESEEERDEKEKDIWELDKLDLKIRKNPIYNIQTINFKAISQPNIREEVKKAIYRHLEYESLGTVQNEMTSMRNFSDYLKKKQPGIQSCLEIDRDVLEGYLIFRMTENESCRSASDEIRKLRAVLESIGKMYDAPHLEKLFINTDIPPELDPEFKVYSDGEMKRLMACITRLDEQIARCMVIHQMLGTRISDTLTLRMGCLSKTDGHEMIRIEQVKTRVYEKPVSREVAALIEKAMEYTAGKYGKTEYIFVDGRNTSAPLQYTTVKHKVLRMIQEENLRDDKGNYFKFNTHMFRHYYGVKLTELHLDDWTIARLLGHKGLNSVKHYRKMSNQLMADETRKVREMMTEIIYANLDGWGAEYEQIRQNDRGK